jgi:hypothetical protein
MLEPTYKKPNVQPHSYTLTSKRSLGFLTSDDESYFYITRIVWGVGGTKRRGVNLTNVASIKKPATIFQIAGQA